MGYGHVQKTAQARAANQRAAGTDACMPLAACSKRQCKQQWRAAANLLVGGPPLKLHGVALFAVLHTTSKVEHGSRRRQRAETIQSCRSGTGSGGAGGQAEELPAARNVLRRRSPWLPG